MTEPYLATLNPEQRHAVEYNGDQPLLIIAGAGSGKTNTLAHRVAHLIVQRADPRRMMLLTFSRRAAIGARLLREYSDQIGLDRAFTIHDRGDSADLINLVRHDLGLSKTERRFPAKNTCLAKDLRSERPSAEQPQLVVSVRDETDQARCVVDLVLEYREAGVLLKRQAVLFRASHHSGPLELELAGCEGSISAAVRALGVEVCSPRPSCCTEKPLAKSASRPQ
jgi:superfamily I DNA/RNA helicase